VKIVLFLEVLALLDGGLKSTCTDNSAPMVFPFL
jgi:hypothetical protein